LRIGAGGFPKGPLGRETTMDASEFFNTVVKPNYDDFTKMDDYRSLWNAIVSMNTVPEYMAFEQLNMLACRANSSTPPRSKYAAKTKA